MFCAILEIRRHMVQLCLWETACITCEFAPILLISCSLHVSPRNKPRCAYALKFAGAHSLVRGDRTELRSLHKINRRRKKCQVKVGFNSLSRLQKSKALKSVKA